MNVIRRSYSVLAVLTALCLGTYVVLPFILPGAPQGWRDFLLSVGTNLLVIIIAFILVESVIKQREEQERDKYRAVALRRLRIPLTHHLQLLSDMYKASVERKPDREISNLRDLFSEHYFEQITYFNAIGPSPAAEPMSLRAVTSGAQRRWIPWYQYLSTEVKQFKEEVDRVLDKYAMYLDSETLDLLEQLANSPVVMTVGQLPMTATMLLQTWGPQQAYNPFILEEDQPIVREHTDVFSRLVDIYNKEATDDRKIFVRNDRVWKDNVSPAVGSARALYRRLENGRRWIPPASPTEQSPDAEAEQRPE